MKYQTKVTSMEDYTKILITPDRAAQIALDIFDIRGEASSYLEKLILILKSALLEMNLLY